MRFNGNLNIDFTKWTQVKLERENNMRDIKIEEEQPKWEFYFLQNKTNYFFTSVNFL